MKSTSPTSCPDARDELLIGSNVDITPRRSRASRRPPAEFPIRPEDAPPIENFEEDLYFGDLDRDAHPRSFSREGPELHSMSHATLEDELAPHEEYLEWEWEDEDEVEARESHPAATGIISLDHDEVSYAGTESTEYALPEGMDANDYLARHLGVLADDSERPEWTEQVSEENIADLWERARVRGESRQKPEDSTPDVDTDMDAGSDADFNSSPTRPRARFNSQYDHYAAPLTQSTIRDFIARNMNGRVDEVLPPAFSEIPIGPSPASEQLWQCSGPSPIDGRCVLDADFARCAHCEWKRKLMGGDFHQFTVRHHHWRAGPEEDFIPLVVGDDEMEDGYGKDRQGYNDGSEEMDIDIDFDVDDTATHSRAPRRAAVRIVRYHGAR